MGYFDRPPQISARNRTASSAPAAPCTVSTGTESKYIECKRAFMFNLTRRKMLEAMAAGTVSMTVGSFFPAAAEEVAMLPTQSRPRQVEFGFDKYRAALTETLGLSHIDPAIDRSETSATCMDFGNHLRSLNRKTVGLIMSFEGWDGVKVDNDLWRPTWDSYGHCWNVGPGLTHGIDKNAVYSKAQIDKMLAYELRGAVVDVMTAEAMLKHRMGMTEADVRNPGVHVLNDNQFGALVSFDYNLGAGNLRKIINAPGVVDADHKIDFAALGAKMKEFDHAGGQKLDRLTRLRAQEVQLAMTPCGHQTSCFGRNLRYG